MRSLIQTTVKNYRKRSILLIRVIAWIQSNKEFDRYLTEYEPSYPVIIENEKIESMPTVEINGMFKPTLQTFVNYFKIINDRYSVKLKGNIRKIEKNTKQISIQLSPSHEHHQSVEFLTNRSASSMKHMAYFTSGSNFFSTITIAPTTTTSYAHSMSPIKGHLTKALYGEAETKCFELSPQKCVLKLANMSHLKAVKDKALPLFYIRKHFLRRSKTSAHVQMHQ